MNSSDYTSVDKNAFIAGVLDQCEFFVQTHVWPTAQELHYQDWLENFKGVDEQFVAAKMLSALMYYPDIMSRNLLKASVGNAILDGSRDRGLTLDSFVKELAYFTTILGEDESPTGSGGTILTMLRDQLFIPSDRIVDAAGLDAVFLEEGMKKELYIIICDDFIGSGEQSINFLSGKCRPRLGQSIYDYAKDNGHRLSFASMLANQDGYNVLRSQLSSLDLYTGHILGDEYNLFHPTSLCWGRDKSLYAFGTELILGKSQEIGIPDDRSRRSARGFENQGLFVGFRHGFPDAVPAIFYANNKGWAPLMERRT